MKELDLFLNKFWFAPQDAFLRAFESRIWRDLTLKSPVLDIGCGDGEITKLLFKSKRKLDVGIDLEQKVVLRAKRSGVYKKVLAADAAQMPFGDKSLKTVISNSTFEHIEDDISAAKEVARVLKPGGYFILTTTTPRLKRLVKRLTGRRFIDFNRRVAHYHYRAEEDWQKILRDSGFRIVSIKYYFSPKAVSAWFKLFRLATFKPWHRELWSYLSDSRYAKLFPKNFAKYITRKYLAGFFKEPLFDKNGCWVLIIARRRS